MENIVPTGNDEEDQRNKKRLLIELQRLQRNKERREARERQGKKNSFGGDVMSPEATTPGSPMTVVPPPGKTVTTRKCANCGQAGHIRNHSSFILRLVGYLLTSTRHKQEAVPETKRNMGRIRNESTCSCRDADGVLRKEKLLHNMVLFGRLLFD